MSILTLLAAGWAAFIAFLLALLAVVSLIERLSGRCPLDLVSDWLGRESREDHDRARRVLAHQREERLARIAADRQRVLAGYRPRPEPIEDAIEALSFEAERVCQRTGMLEAALALPCAPNPRLRESHGNWYAYDRRLAEERRNGAPW